MITKKPQRKIKSDKINGLPEIAALKTLEEIFSMKNKMAEVIDWYEKKQTRAAR